MLGEDLYHEHDFFSVFIPAGTESPTAESTQA
jgi:hypothetical protein